MSVLRLITSGGLDAPKGLLHRTPVDEYSEPRSLDTGRLSDEARARLVQTSRVGFVGVRRRCTCGRFVERGHWGCEPGRGCRA